jgi:hypothetical protein
MSRAEDPLGRLGRGVARGPDASREPRVFHVEQRRPEALRSPGACSTWNVRGPADLHVLTRRQRPLFGAPVRPSIRLPECSPFACWLPTRPVRRPPSRRRPPESRHRIHRSAPRHGRQGEWGYGAPRLAIVMPGARQSVTTILEQGLSTHSQPGDLDVAAVGRIPGCIPFSCNRPGRPARGLWFALAMTPTATPVSPDFSGVRRSVRFAPAMTSTANPVSPGFRGNSSPIACLLGRPTSAGPGPLQRLLPSRCTARSRD